MWYVPLLFMRFPNLQDKNLSEIEKQTPSFLKDTEAIKKLQKKKQQQVNMVVKGIKNEKSLFENLKMAADDFFRMKNFEKANEAYQEIIQKIERLENEEGLRPNVKIIYHKGRKYLEKNNFEVLSNLGQTQIKLKQYDKAIQILQKAIEKNESNPKNYFRLAKCYK